MGTVLESIYGVGSNKGIPASRFPGPLVNRSQPDSLAKVADPVPSHRAVSRKIHGHLLESYSTNRLSCIVCQVKNIQCSYKNDLSLCEACRKSKVRCIKEVPLGQTRQISLPSINSLVETDREPGKSGDSATLQYRSVVDLTNDAEVAGPALLNRNSNPGPIPNCRRCRTIDNCARCPKSEGYRFLCEICRDPCLTCKLGNPTPDLQPPKNNHQAHHSSPALNRLPEVFNRHVAVDRPLQTTPQHLSAGKKRRISASEAIQEDQEAIKRARNGETSQKFQARMARENEELMMGNEALEDELALLRRVAAGV